MKRRSSLRLSSLGSFLFLFLFGCHSYDDKKGLPTQVPPDQFLDYNEFVCGVQPVLIRRCSYQACHGNADHALRIYSAGKLRATPPTTRNQRDSSLTSDEVAGNFDSASGMVYAATAEERAKGIIVNIPLLQKPLAARFGGAEHHGVAIFPQYPAAAPEVDDDWNRMVRWVAGTKQPSPPTAACSQLFATMGLSPRSTP